MGVIFCLSDRQRTSWLAAIRVIRNSHKLFHRALEMYAAAFNISTKKMIPEYASAVKNRGAILVGARDGANDKFCAENTAIYSL